jgi:hypothetical protein
LTLHFQNRLLRNYRNLWPSRFHAFNTRVRTALTDNPNIPDSIWGANPGLLASYLTASEKYDALYHEAHYGSVLVIAERELMQAQLVNFLDEIAADLEAEAVRTPSLLLSSGFDLVKERRGNTRKNAALPDAEMNRAEQHDSNS